MRRDIVVATLLAVIAREHLATADVRILRAGETARQDSKCIPGSVRGLGREGSPASAGSSLVPGLGMPGLKLE